MRIGIGVDAHRFDRERKLILGGVKIDFEMGLHGHSDADVLIHSIIDAILGALNKGDIGQLFPDTDNTYKNISSIELLKKVKEINNMKIVNIDSVIICEMPKIAPYIEKMKEKISEALDIDKNRISIKGTTTEYMGFTGRKEGIASISIALME